MSSRKIKMEENIQTLLIMFALIMATFSFVWTWRNILLGIDKYKNEVKDDKQ